MRASTGPQQGCALAKQLAWSELQRLNPKLIASRSGARLEGRSKLLRLAFLDQQVSVSPAEQTLVAEGSDLNPLEQVLILRYLVRCDGTPPTCRWISFREFPGGSFYYGPFLSRTATRLARRFGNDPEAFCRASERLNGDALTFGDRSYLYRLLPKVWLAVVLYVGDEEFPPEVTILFDETLKRYLSTEDCAAGAQVLTDRLLRTSGPRDRLP